jgi:arsenate reductase
MNKPKVLFLCTANSCRSQMAEGSLRHHAGDRFEVFSAGAKPGKLNASAVEAMKELGIDISGHCSKDVAEFLGQSFEYVVRVCDKVRDLCPVFPGAMRYLDWSIEDPAAAEGSPAQRMNIFRRVRDEIEVRVLDFVAKHP